MLSTGCLLIVILAYMMPVGEVILVEKYIKLPVAMVALMLLNIWQKRFMRILKLVLL